MSYIIFVFLILLVYTCIIIIGVSLLVPIIGASLSEHHTAVQNPPIIYNYIITMVIRYSEHHLNVTFTYCYYNTL